MWSLRSRQAGPRQRDRLSKCQPRDGHADANRGAGGQDGKGPRRRYGSERPDPANSGASTSGASAIWAELKASMAPSSPAIPNVCSAPMSASRKVARTKSPITSPAIKVPRARPPPAVPAADVD